MKIQQLPLGARFEYEGEEYVKTGPLFAAGKGGQRLIPKYAVLKPIGVPDSVQEKATSDPLPRAAVLKAFEAFCSDCDALVPEDRKTAWTAAQTRFLKVLG